MAMKILCPNCQKPVSVDEQHAGQLLKCPLCGGTFTVPLLPAAAPPLAGTPADLSRVPGTVGPPMTQGYGLAPEPAPTQPLPPPRIDVPSPLAGTVAEARARPLEESPPPPPPGGYLHTRTYRLNPRAVPWLAPVALVLVFVLSFFPWVGMYPGGERVFKQNAWQAAFGGMSSVDRVWESMANWDRLKTGDGDLRTVSVGASGMLIFFLLLFLVSLAVGVGTAFAESDPKRFQLPPRVRTYWPWRQLIVAGLAGLVLLLLLVELFKGFPLENHTAATVDRAFSEQRKSVMSDDGKRRLELQESETLSQYHLRRTNWLRLVIVLLVVTVAGALLDHWLQRRGGRPLPRADLMW